MNKQQAHHNMMYQQIRSLNFVDETILNALSLTPRDFFVPANYSKLAFAETAIPLGHAQSMMLPAEEARMLQVCDLRSTDKILEIGTGSGYITAVLAKLCAQVDTIDIFPEFVEQAQEKTKQLNLNNINFYCGDIFNDKRIKDLYDVVVVTGSLPQLPDQFRRLLTPTGRMFAVLGNLPVMSACIVTINDKQNWQVKSLYEAVLTKLINAPESTLFFV